VTAVTVIATAICLFAIGVALIALIIAAVAYDCARDASERIDALWGDLFDDEIEYLRREGDL
jgi:hypothetical protein